MALSGLLATQEGCLALFGKPVAASAPKQASDKPAEEQTEDDEAGIERLTALMRGFSNALQTKQFDQADAQLKRAEHGVKEASVVTRSHPDFEDMAERVQKARPRLEDAIERDRIERRNAAIDAIIRRGELAAQQAGGLIAALQTAPAQSGDAQQLDEAVKTFADLKREGEGFMDEPRYRAHASAREALAAKLAGLQARTQTQLSLQEAIGPAIEEGIVAANKAKSASGDAERQQALQAVVAAFSRCSAALLQSRNLGTDPRMLLDTRLGRLSMQQTYSACGATEHDAQTRLRRFAWESAVRSQVAALQGPISTLHDATSPAQREAASVRAEHALQDCENNGQLTSQLPGYDPRLEFDTPLGKLTAAGLLAKCSSEATRLRNAAAGLHWQTQAAELPNRLTETKRRLDEASHAEEPGRSAEAWSSALGGLQECLARSQELLGSAGANKAATFATPWGNLAMTAIARRCGDEKGRAEKNLAQALKRVQAQSFAATCHGDEIEVARREGVPTRIEVMPQGRVFVYAPADGHGPTRRLGFDKDGKRVDFSVQWKGNVESMLAGLQGPLQAAAGQGQAAQQAIEQLLPALDACQNGSVTDRHAGYDETVVFATPWGALHAPELRKACGQQAIRARDRLAGLAWQARAEALRDRADAAAASLKQAEASTQPTAQAALVGAASGGFTECSERATALMKAPNADKSFKVDSSSFGRVTLPELAKACQKAQPAAAARLQKAMAAVKLEAFVQTCRGDEAAVAQREGIPTRVEPVGKGRVFVYAKKRIAFDAQGQRTDENLLH